VSVRVGHPPRVVAFYALVAALLAGAALASLAVGAATLPLDAVIGGLLGTDGSTEGFIVRSLRLPRTVLGLGVGASLAVAGALLQGLFRNPLADPGLLGVTGGAGAAVAVTLVGVGALGLSAEGLLGVAALGMVPVAAFVGGLGATALVFAIGRVRGRTSVATMLLAGIAVNALAGTITGFAVFFADDARLRDLTFWAMGGLGGASWSVVAVTAPLMLVAVVVAFALARPLDVLQLGEAEALHLGVPVERVKRAAVALTALLAGLAVAAAGGVGFIGLVVPHVVRLAIGPRHAALIPAPALLGGALTVAADLVSRTAAAPAELPLGLLTALLGAPFFLGLLVARRRGEA
jgi:iron complex transport system permease protein